MDADDFDIEELELGERAAEWLLRDEFGQLYSRLKDRAWSATLGCYAKCVASLGAENVPDQWRPTFDEHGMWTGLAEVREKAEG